jgi:hypothetical protein
VYSKTVFYAGSYWNVYIQKVKSTKNVQLGVYLHRAKDREGSGSSSSNTPMNHQRDGEVGQIITIDDSRIVERHSRNTITDLEDADPTATLDSITSNSQANISASRSLPSAGNGTGSGAGSNVPEISVPALGHYVDSRPTIQTYFKIFSPSRKGKMLSMFSSGPDSFNFSQSWGWKSSSLILEEGVITGGSGGADGAGDEDMRLKFMVVLGKFLFYISYMFYLLMWMGYILILSTKQGTSRFMGDRLS